MRPALVTVALGLALGVVAGTFDAEPLWTPAVAFAVLGGAAAAWIAASARGVTVTREIGARRVVEDEPLDVRIEVRAGRLPLPTGALVEPLLSEPVPLRPGQRRLGVRVQARFGRRGRRDLAAPVAVLRDPLGLATRPVAAADRAEVLVLPRVHPVRALAEGGGSGGRRGRPAAAAETELDGVREHRPGTPASRIYWPALARGAGLLERRLTAETDTRPLVVLDTRGAGGEGFEEDLDKAVRAVASLAVSLAQQGGCQVLVPGDRRATALDPSLGGWPHLHARLALIGADGPGRPPLTAVGARGGPVVYVAARTPARIPRVLEQAPANGRTLVVPGALPGRRAAFAVAGCRGYELEPGGRAHAAA